MKESFFFFLSFIAIKCFSQTDTIKQVKIGEQIWMSENLNVDRFRNGDLIIQAITDDDWKRADVNRRPAWCYYNNDSANGPVYGKLYNWYAVIDPRGLAPVGWRIPDDKDWETLVNFLGGVKKAGKKMKSTFGWLENGNGTNSSGFNGMPGGSRFSIGSSFDPMGERGSWWKTGEFMGATGNCLYLWYSSSAVTNIFYYSAPGFSVRCVKK